ncbi:MAG: hypothetical protein AAFW89_06410 [Bacteroidota bacterium]
MLSSLKHSASYMNKLLTILKLSSLVLVSTVVTLLLGEWMVQRIIPQNRLVTWIEMHETGFVMNQSGNISFQELGDRKAEYRFNPQRLRGGSIEPDRVNILTIGDSFTFGLLLNEEDTYVNRLQQKADVLYPDSLQFLNGGIGGSGLADWPAWLEEFGRDADPDYLVYFMNYDDINRALSKNLHVFDPSSSDSLIKSQRWKPRPILPYLAQKNWYRWVQEHSDLGNIIVRLLWRNVYFEDITRSFDPSKSTVRVPEPDSFSEESDYAIHLGNAILNTMDSWCARNGCEFIVITTGFFEEENMSLYDQKFYRWYQQNRVSQPGERYFDNTPCVESNAVSGLDELIIPEDTHPNEKGAQVIADCTWDQLKSIFDGR